MVKLKLKLKKAALKKNFRRGGQPTKFDSKQMKLIKACVLNGMIDVDIAEVLGVTVRTYHNWKQKNPKFFHSLKDWKIEADKEVEKSLYHRAKGFIVPEEKVFQFQGKIVTHDTTKYYPPDTTAGMFILNNRKPKDWKNKQEIEGNFTMPPTKVTVNVLGGKKDGK